MIEDFCKLLNCCQPRMNLDKYVIKEKLKKNEMGEINDTPNSKNLMIETSKKISDSIISFSNLQVSQKKKVKNF